MIIALMRFCVDLTLSENVIQV